MSTIKTKRAKDLNVAVALAQKDYKDKFLCRVKKELSFIETCIERLPANNTDSLFLNMTEDRKKLISPYIITDDLFARRWQEQNIRSNTYRDEEKIYETKRGEKVRSKSEKILADTFLEFNIPYFYEKPLKLKNKSVRYPDFTLLKVETREEIYLEHLGLLDNEEYRCRSLKKLDEYRQNGIFFGKNLLITYEADGCPFDIASIRKMIQELFKR